MSEWSALGYAITELGRDILDVAPKGVAGVSGTVDRHGAEMLKATTTSGELKQRSTGSWPSQDECMRMPLASEVTISVSPADSVISDRHGDDRFADNILRALEGLPQNGDDEEERDAAEEGALIEASNLPDPQFESNGR